MNYQEVKDVIEEIKPEEFYTWLLAHRSRIFVRRDCALCPLAIYLTERLVVPVNISPESIRVFSISVPSVIIEAPAWMIAYMQAFDNHITHTVRPADWAPEAALRAYKSIDFSSFVTPMKITIDSPIDEFCS